MTRENTQFLLVFQTDEAERKTEKVGIKYMKRQYLVFMVYKHIFVPRKHM